MTLHLPGGVELPRHLLSQHRAGCLAFFAGAGVSVPDPTGLPTFAGLVDELEQRARVEANHELDLTERIERLVARGVDVRRLTASALGRRGGPNALHEALVTIARGAALPLVVTTNFDPAFESVPGAGELQVRAYPDLPYDASGAGLVYLHGRLVSVPRGDEVPPPIVLTARDFASAYVGPASRVRDYYHALLDDRCVVFVGFSGDDPLFRYLQLARYDEGAHYAFVPSGNRSLAERWRELGVRVLAYDGDEANHVALGVALQAWASAASLTGAALVERIESLAEGSPDDLERFDSDVLARSLDDRGAVAAFVDAAKDPSWVAWAIGESLLDGLRDGREPADPDVAVRLDTWSTTMAMQHVEADDELWQFLTAAGPTMSPRAWHAVGWALHRHDSITIGRRRRWMVRLARTRPLEAADWLEYSALTLPDDGEDALFLLLLEACARPYLQGADQIDPLRFGGAAHDVYDLEQVGQAAVARLPRIGAELASLCATMLRDASEMVRARGDDFDVLSFRRNAIAGSDDQRVRDRADVLIDLARDAVSALANDDVLAARAVVRGWLGSSTWVLRRLAVHALLEVMDDVHASTEALLSNDWLTDYRVRPEVFPLLAEVADALPAATVDVLVTAFVSAVDDGDGTSEGEFRVAYARWRPLAWMARHGARSVSLDAALEELQALLPDDVQLGDRPELLSWMTVGWVQEVRPMSVDDFIDAFRIDPARLLGSFVDLPPDRRASDDGVPTRAGLADLIREATEADPAIALALLADDVVDLIADLVPSVVNAVAHRADPDGLEPMALLEAVERHASLAYPADVARLGSLLLGQPDTSVGSRVLAALDAAFTAHGRGSAGGVDALVESALEVTRVADHHGVLTAVRVVGAWSTSDGEAGRAVRRALGRRLGVLRRNQPVVFQLLCRLRLDRGDPDLVAGAAEAGVWSEDLHGLGLGDGLLGHLHARDDDADLPPPLVRALAVQLIVGSDLDFALDWRAATSAQQATAVLDEVTPLLREASGRFRARVWDQRLRSYWLRRDEGEPRSLTTGERAALMGWALSLGPDEAEKALRYVEAARTPLAIHSAGLHELAGGGIMRAPQSYLAILSHGLDARTEGWADHHLSKIIQLLRDEHDRTDRTAFVEAALAAGFWRARDW